MKIIQVFLAGQGSAELSDELISLKLKDGYARVKSRSDDGTPCEHIFPFQNLSMIRLFKADKE